MSADLAFCTTNWLSLARTMVMTIKVSQFVDIFLWNKDDASKWSDNDTYQFYVCKLFSESQWARAHLHDVCGGCYLGLWPLYCLSVQLGQHLFIAVQLRKLWVRKINRVSSCQCLGFSLLHNIRHVIWNWLVHYSPVLSLTRKSDGY